MDYLLVDPFGAHARGVSSYTTAAAERLATLGVRVRVLVRALEEPIGVFRRRVATAAAGFKGIVEAPETMQAGRFVPADRLHIRLHGSRVMGQIMQNQSFELSELAYERAEIARARFVSAPSRVALQASGMAEARPDAVCYPNPSGPLDSGAIPRDIDVLYLGRWQRFKGKDFFVDLVAQSSSNLRFAVASNSGERLPPRVAVLAADNEFERRKTLWRAKLVLIPSYFETASMVGLEAAAHGCKVAGWSHLGVAEYFAPPIYSACGAFGQVCMTTVSRLLEASYCEDAVAQAIGAVNRCFDQGVASIFVDGVACSAMPFDRERDYELDSIIKQCRDMNSTNKSVLPRKLRKLLRDPRAFFSDAALIRTLTRPGWAIKVQSHDAHLPMLPLEVPSCVPMADPPAAEPPAPRALLEMPAKAPRRFVTIGAGKIEVREPAKRVTGWNCGFLFDPVRCEYEGAWLAEAFAQFLDFSPLAKTLEIGHFKSELGASLALLNAMDVANKNRLAMYPTLVLFEAPSALVRALRCSNTETRTILIARREFADIDHAHTDVVIVEAGHPAASSDANAEGIRRRIVTDRWQDAPLAVRRALQELGPRSPDMLIPLINANAFDPNLSEFDVRYHQGIIRLKAPLGTSTRVLSMNDVCALLAERIDSMLVSESVYMRYRSLCEAVEAGQSPARLIECALFDGVLFHVEA